MDRSVAIDTVPMPDRQFRAPEKLVAEFRGDLRVVVRRSVLGIPVPRRFINELIGKGMELMLIAKEH